MKIQSQVMVLCTLIVFVPIKPNVVDDIKKWWAGLTEAKKASAYKTAQEHIGSVITPKYLRNLRSEAFPKDYVSEEIVQPQLKYATDYLEKYAAEKVNALTGKAKTGVAWTAGVAAAGAATYALYRWAARKGLGGVTKDSQAIDKNWNDLLHEIDKKKNELKNKKPLSSADKQLGKGLSALIASKAKDWEFNISKLRDKEGEINKIIKIKKETVQSEEEINNKPEPQTEASTEITSQEATDRFKKKASLANIPKIPEPTKVPKKQKN
jgi:hypothetical protein